MGDVQQYELTESRVACYGRRMPQIHLDDWAASKGVPQRTAQRWAKEKLIPAKKQKITKQIVKTWLGYVIDEDEPLPDLSR